jgi:lysine biosynthesis protein LysW
LRLPGRVMIGEVFDCEHCRATLEVAELDPPQLERFAPIEEDPEDFLEFDLL